MQEKCLICSSRDFDKHHFKTRGSGGLNDEWNLLKLCREHHTEIHQIGNNNFVKKYPIVESWLLGKGWEFCLVQKKWKHYGQ